MKSPRAWHPPLFALHPVLALYAANVSLIPWREALVPALACVAGTVAGWWLLARLLRDGARAAAAASVGVWLAFTSDVWRPWILGWADGSGSEITAFQQGGAVAAILAAMVLAGWKNRSNSGVSGFLNVMGLAMCVIALASALGTHGAIRRELARNADPTAAASVASGGPDIFHITLDGYGRTDVLKRDYGFSDRVFVDGLRDRGFLVVDNARSNYVQTELSLASMLNMAPAQALVKQQGNSTQERGILDALIDENEVSRTLRQRGYRYIALTSGFPALSFGSADLVLGDEMGGTLFVNALRAKTPFPPGSKSAGSQFESRHRMLRGVFSNLSALAPHGSTPRFVLAHVLAPHPPFVFGPNGELRLPQRAFGLEDGSHYMELRASRGAYIAGYRDQAQYIATLTLEAIDALLAAPGEKPVIVLHGDHGPKAHLDQDSLAETDVNESFPTLLAIHAPGRVLQRMEGHNTLINVYGAVLSGLFALPDKPKPENSYYSAWDTPLKFTDVTSKIAPRLPPKPSQ